MATATAPIESVALGKLTYGIRPADRVAFKKLGLSGWLDKQLDPAAVENDFVKTSLSTFGSLGLTSYGAYSTFPYSIRNSLVADEVVFATLIRRYWSDRQVFEMLVEFFHDYNPVPRGSDDYALASYDSAVIRANVLGNYPDLVLASSRHPGMLNFLNGNDNLKDHPNENYGRELLELFTVSTVQPYTQDDVVNAARVLTGIAWPSPQQDLVVRIGQHWNGPVSVLGWSDPNPGGSRQAILATAESLIRYLALHSATAQAFSLRMARRFVSDSPPKTLVNAMANTYTKTGGNIPAVFKTMATSQEFANSFRAKTKRPSEFVGSVIRGLDLTLTRPILPGDPMRDDYFGNNPARELHMWSMKQGHVPFGWPFPNGFPDTAPAWTTMAAQVNRWNLGHQLAYGWGSSSLSKPNYRTLLPSSANSPEQVLDAAAKLYLGAVLPSDERAATLKVMAQVGGKSTSASWERKAEVAVGLVLSKPEWNLR